MDEVKFQQDEIKFLKKRIDQTKTQLKTFKTMNQMLLNQMASTDKVCCQFYGIDASVNETTSVKSSSSSKITSKNYDVAIEKVLGSSKEATQISEATLLSIMAYQQERISKLSGMLSKTVPSSSVASFRETQQQATLLEKSMLKANTSRDELSKSLLKAMDDEAETKNKLVYYLGAEADSVLGPSQLLCPIISQNTNELEVKKSTKKEKTPTKTEQNELILTNSTTSGLNKSSTLMRKSTAKLKPIDKSTLKSE